MYRLFNFVIISCLCLTFLKDGIKAHPETTKWRNRSLKSIFDALETGCVQGPPETVTQETMLNHHNWWELNWGRTGASWPRRGFSSCWGNRGSVCALPDRDNTVCLPGSRRGSTIAQGWGLDPKSQACKPGVHCLYACAPGFYWTTYNQKETSNFDSANAHQRGHCDGTWNYGTSSHGVLCKPDGTLAMPNKPLCAMGETYVYAENKLDTHVFLCQTIFPGHEIFLIPTLVRPGETVMITTQPVDFWHGPSYSKPTHGDFYVSFAGADIMEACTWDEFSPSGAALLPYELGSGVEDNGVVYSTHYFYQQPNSEVPKTHVGYEMDLVCSSSEPGVCGPVFKNNNVVKADVLKRPRNPSSTKVKFVFRKPGKNKKHGEIYREPARAHLHDLGWAPGMKAHTSATGRRLQSTPELNVFLQNTLGEPITLCGSELFSTRTTVGPGEKILLQQGEEIKITTKQTETSVCTEDTEIHWVINTGNASSTSSAGHGTFAFYPYHGHKNIEHGQDYTLVLKCDAEEGSHSTAVSTVSKLCEYHDESSVSFFNSEVDIGLNPQITFLVQYSSKPHKQDSQDLTYAWGHILSKTFTKFLKSSKTSTNSATVSTQ